MHVQDMWKSFSWESLITYTLDYIISWITKDLLKDRRKDDVAIDIFCFSMIDINKTNEKEGFYG